MNPFRNPPAPGSSTCGTTGTRSSASPAAGWCCAARTDRARPRLSRSSSRSCSTAASTRSGSNPFAAEDRTMKSNLLFRGGENAARLCMAGVAARGQRRGRHRRGRPARRQRHRDTPVRWHFVADGRVGEDFSLHHRRRPADDQEAARRGDRRAEPASPPPPTTAPPSTSACSASAGSATSNCSP